MRTFFSKKSGIVSAGFLLYNRDVIKTAGSLRQIARGRPAGEEGSRLDKLLKSLFDYQKFDQNPELQKIIDSVHARYSMKELDLDELEYVSAAGSRELPLKREIPLNKKIQER